MTHITDNIGTPGNYGGTQGKKDFSLKIPLRRVIIIWLIAITTLLSVSCGSTGSFHVYSFGGLAKARGPRALRRRSALILYITTAFLLLPFLTAPRYGYFGDEMYHMACGEHLDWGYVDQPRLIAVFAWMTRHVFGTSRFAIHLLPALAGFALVWLPGLLATKSAAGVSLKLSRPYVLRVPACIWFFTIFLR